jgi:hypothetical protein
MGTLTIINLGIGKKTAGIGAKMFMTDAKIDAIRAMTAVIGTEEKTDKTAAKTAVTDVKTDGTSKTA